MRNSNHFGRSGRRNKTMRDERTEKLMQGMPLQTDSSAAEWYAKQVLVEKSCVLITCVKCGRKVYHLEIDTGLCLVCVGKELESA
jgi:hypothetical protein